MPTIRGLAVSSVVRLLAAPTAFAEKLRGFLWETSPQAISVDGQSVRLTSETKIERRNHKDITARRPSSGSLASIGFWLAGA